MQIRRFSSDKSFIGKRKLQLPKMHETRLHIVRRLTRNLVMHISNEQKDRHASMTA